MLPLLLHRQQDLSTEMQGRQPVHRCRVPPGMLFVRRPVSRLLEYTSGEVVLATLSHTLVAGVGR